MELYKYLNNNKEGLLPYDKRGIKISEPQKGIIYRGMGGQENHKCGKGSEKRWKRKVGNDYLTQTFKTLLFII